MKTSVSGGSEAASGGRDQERACQTCRLRSAQRPHLQPQIQSEQTFILLNNYISVLCVLEHHIASLSAQ